MGLRSLLLLSPLLVPLAGPAYADCRSDIKVLEKDVQTRSEAIEENDMTPNEAPPAENWFGSAPSLDSASDRLDSARMLAESGNEDGCLEVLDEVRAILVSLESEG